MATISTHNGSSVSRGHNIRDKRCTRKDEHIDFTRPHESWVDESPREAYHRLFDQAVEDYNHKQARSDRRVNDYYDQICNDGKKHPVYEMIIGLYPGEGESISDAQGKTILKEFVSGWQERNPQLELIGAYYHADELGKAPHVHIDYIPVAYGYKRGMEVQSALNKAYEQQGFAAVSKTVTPQILWEQRENNHLESLCNKAGIKIEHPQEGHGVKHLQTEIYKATKDLEQIDRDKAILSRESSQLKFDTHKLSRQKDFTVSQIKTLEEERDTLKSSVDDLSVSEYDLQMKIVSLDLDAQKQAEDIQKRRKEQKNIEEGIIALKGQISGLECKRDALKAEIEPLQQEQYTIKADLKQLRNDYEKANKVYEHNKTVIANQDDMIASKKGIIAKLETKIETLVEPFIRILADFRAGLQRADVVAQQSSEQGIREVEKARSNALDQIDKPAEPVPLSVQEMNERISAGKVVYVKDLESGKVVKLDKYSTAPTNKLHLIAVMDGKSVAFADAGGLGNVEPLRTMAKDTVNQEADNKITQYHRPRRR